jgi:hypothetical protein
MENMKRYLLKARTLIVIFLAAASFAFSVSPTRGLYNYSESIKLADIDRAEIVQSVLREVFNPEHNIEGEHLILADGIRPDWLPQIPKFNLILVSRRELESYATPPRYYVVRLKPMAASVRVTVNIYDMSDERYPEVELYYSYRKKSGKWKGKYLYGGGN